MSSPPAFSSVPSPKAPYPPPAPPGPPPPQFGSAAVAATSSSSTSTTAPSASQAESGAPEEEKPLFGFGTGSFGSFGSSASSGFGGGMAFGSCSIPASDPTPASSASSSGGFRISGSSSTGFGGSSFGTSSAASSSSSGFGGGSLFGASTAQPASSPTTSSSFGFGSGLVPPSSPSIKSPFGLPAGHQPAVATPVPSAAASVFGCSVSYPHPSTFQVPPTSQMFGEPVVPVSALVVDEEEGSVRFSPRKDAEFRYRLTLTKSDRIQIWIEDKASKHQWESKELELSEIVPADRAIPMMELSDYFECFRKCLSVSNTNLFKGPSKYEIVLLPVEKDKEMRSSGSTGSVELQLTVGVQIFSKVLTPTYSFALQPVKLSEMDILNAKIRDQDEEIESLRAQVGALASKMGNAATPLAGLFGGGNPFLSYSVAPQYIRAETTNATFSNQPMVWTRTDEASGLFGGIYHVQNTGGINILQNGLYNIQLVVHHTNAYDPEDRTNTRNGPFGVLWSPQAAFVLQKNGQPIASSFGSTAGGTTQSSPLCHILQLKRDDELRVVYTGAGVATAGSYILISQIK